MNAPPSTDDVRLIRLSGDDPPLEIGPQTLLTLLWTSGVALTYAVEVAAALVTSLAHTAWLVSGERTTSLASVLLPLVVLALPIPGVVVYAGVWWPSLRRPGSRSGHVLCWLVPGVLVVGALVGADFALRANGLL